MTPLTVYLPFNIDCLRGACAPAKLGGPCPEPHGYWLVIRDQALLVVHDGQGARQLALDCPKRYEELVEEVGEDEVARAARLITLFHLDRGWTDHLAFLEELREGIHLRVLGRRDPLDEFNAEAVPVFKGFLDEARSRAAEAFEEAEVVDGSIDVASIGVKRPSSTWTYMVHDRPFGSDMDNVVGHARRALGNR